MVSCVCCWVVGSIVSIVFYVFNFFMSVALGHGRGKRLGMCLMFEPHVLGVVSLQHVPMFEYAGYARAWTRQAPWYMPCARAACVVC